MCITCPKVDVIREQRLPADDHLLALIGMKLEISAKPAGVIDENGRNVYIVEYTDISPLESTAVLDDDLAAAVLSLYEEVRFTGKRAAPSDRNIGIRAEIKAKVFRILDSIT